MMPWLFLEAALIGFCIAAPVGPCGLLCITRSMRSGFRSGVATGGGVALADTVYAAIGAFGMSALVVLLEHWAQPLRIAGAGFLIYLGLRIALAKPPATDAPPEEDGLHSAFASSFLITLANPMTIFSFIAIFAGLGAAPGGGWRQALLMVLGIGLGSFVWWILLSWLSAHFGKRLNPAWAARITRFAGWVIVALGVAALVTIGKK